MLPNAMHRYLTEMWSHDADAPGTSQHPARYQPWAKKGWLLTRVERTGEAYYRYLTVGFNLYNGERFSWRVPSLSGASYDFSQLVGKGW